jgi:diguanylate cyclase (GGDEF)-like protein
VNRPGFARARGDARRPLRGQELEHRTGFNPFGVLGTARRDYDVVARWEGDELVVLLPTADARAAKTVGKRIVRSLRDGDPVTLPGVPRVTVSIGAAVWSPPSIDTVEDLLHRSASALRAAKTRGACSVDVDADPGGDPKDSAEP